MTQKVEESCALVEEVVSRKPGRLRQLWRIGGAILWNRIRFRHPMMLMHSVTEACQAACPYCPWAHGKKRQDELTLPEIGRVYAEARELGMCYVHFWGGEPLMHPHIGDIVAHAADIGFVTGMITNGGLLRHRADAVVPHLGRLYVSLDYPGEKHDEMRQTPKLYARIIEGLEYVRTKWPKQFILLSFVLCKENSHVVKEMAYFAKQFNARLYVNPMRAAALVSEEPFMTDDSHVNSEAFTVDNSSLVIPWEEQREVWEELLSLKKAGYPIQNSRYYMKLIARKGAAPEYRCHWPKISVGIDANGDIVDCQRWDRPITNVRHAPLKDIIVHPRALELYGEGGEGCYACSSPARVEPSRLWGFHPGMLADVLGNLVFRQ